MKREVGKGAESNTTPHEQIVSYYKVYEEHESGILTPMLYMHLKKGAQLEYPLTKEQIIQSRGFKKVDLEQLVEYRLLKRYTIEGQNDHVYFLSEVKSALKSLKSGC